MPNGDFPARSLITIHAVANSNFTTFIDAKTFIVDLACVIYFSNVRTLFSHDALYVSVASITEAQELIDRHADSMLNDRDHFKE